MSITVDERRVSSRHRTYRLSAEDVRRAIYDYVAKLEGLDNMPLGCHGLVDITECGSAILSFKVESAVDESPTRTICT